MEKLQVSVQFLGPYHVAQMSLGPPPKMFNHGDYFCGFDFPNAGRTAISLSLDDGQPSCCGFLSGFLGGFLNTRWNYGLAKRSEVTYQKIDSATDRLPSPSVLSPLPPSTLLDFLDNLRNRFG